VSDSNTDTEDEQFKVSEEEQALRLKEQQDREQKAAELKKLAQQQKDQEKKD